LHAAKWKLVDRGSLDFDAKARLVSTSLELEES
jgi:hypothetical protein